IVTPLASTSIVAESAPIAGSTVASPASATRIPPTRRAAVLAYAIATQTPAAEIAAAPNAVKRATRQLSGVGCSSIRRVWADPALGLRPFGRAADGAADCGDAPTGRQDRTGDGRRPGNRRGGGPTLRRGRGSGRPRRRPGGPGLGRRRRARRG